MTNHPNFERVQAGLDAGGQDDPAPGFDAHADDLEMDSGLGTGTCQIFRDEDLLNDNGAGRRIAAALCVLMAARTQAQQLTIARLESLLTRAGFVDIECRSTSPLHSVVVGRKP